LPQSNGKIERKHKELGALCRLYSRTPDQIAEFWISGSANVNMSYKEKLEVGDLLWFVQKNQSKVMDFVGLDHIWFKSLLEKEWFKG
jgi:hypothetical protein